jgi:hypothetical protein
MDELIEAFEKRVISEELCPLHAPSLNPRGFYLCGTLKDEIHVGSFCSL